MAAAPGMQPHHTRCLLQGNGTLADGPVQYTVLVNQTAIHGVPTALNAVNQALLRAWTGAPDASIRLVNNPLPMVLGEDALVVNQMSGEEVDDMVGMALQLHAAHDDVCSRRGLKTAQVEKYNALAARLEVRIQDDSMF